MILLDSATPSKDDVFHSISISAGEVSDWLLFPPGIKEVGVDFIPSLNSLAKIQTSNDIDGMENNNAIGIDWDAGSSSEKLARVAIGTRGFRVICDVGSVKVIFHGVLG